MTRPATRPFIPPDSSTLAEIHHAIATATKREERLQTLIDRADAKSERTSLTVGVVLTGVLGMVAGGLLRGPVAAAGLSGLLVALAAAKAVVWPRLRTRQDPTAIDTLPAGPPHAWQPGDLSAHLLRLATRDLHHERDHLAALCRQVAALEAIAVRKLRLVRAAMTAAALAALVLVVAAVTAEVW